MPQGERTEGEKVEFDWMLQNVNLLYLGMRVLVLLDLSYLSRFWVCVPAMLCANSPHTLHSMCVCVSSRIHALPEPLGLHVSESCLQTQFEFWLSLQRVVAPAGLEPAPETERRCEVVPIFNANPLMADGLNAMWASKTVDEAHALLARDDVTVTNQKDKKKQLEKLLKLNDEVRNYAEAPPKAATRSAQDVVERAASQTSFVQVSGGSVREVEMAKLQAAEAV